MREGVSGPGGARWRAARIGVFGRRLLVLLGALSVLAACASSEPERIPRQPYKVVLLPVEGAAAALRDQGAGENGAADGMVPLALTPEELERAIFDGVRGSNAFSEITVAPPLASSADEPLAAVADHARRTSSDLILRLTVKSARIRDLGNNSSTFWSTFAWFMVPLPVWTVDDRTYETNLAVEAALYEPRDVVKPTATVVASSGTQDLDLWDRGLSPWVPIVPPPFLKGDLRTVSEEVTRRAVGQLMAALVGELRSREIPVRFELSVTASDGGVSVVAATRRQLRSLEVFANGRRVAGWAESELVPEKDSTDERRVYRRTVQVPGGAGTEVRVVAQDEAGGREVRTIVLGRNE